MFQKYRPILNCIKGLQLADDSFSIILANWYYLLKSLYCFYNAITMLLQEKIN
jgi:hypothetical protein